MILIGLDVHVCSKVKEYMAKSKLFEVVVHATDSETDESWFLRGRAKGMTHVYSGDLDLYNLCKGTDVVFIRARPVRSLRKQLQLIHGGIKQGKSVW